MSFMASMHSEYHDSSTEQMRGGRTALVVNHAAVWGLYARAGCPGQLASIGQP
jgi:hypothetical protein